MKYFVTSYADEGDLCAGPGHSLPVGRGKGFLRQLTSLIPAELRRMRHGWDPDGVNMCPKQNRHSPKYTRAFYWAILTDVNVEVCEMLKVFVPWNAISATWNSDGRV